VGPVDGAIEAPQVAFDETGLVQLQQQGVEDLAQVPSWRQRLKRSWTVCQGP
jgi:hypothetical protein